MSRAEKLCLASIWNDDSILSLLALWRSWLMITRVRATPGLVLSSIVVELALVAVALTANVLPFVALREKRSKPRSKKATSPPGGQCQRPAGSASRRTARRWPLLVLVLPA